MRMGIKSFLQKFSKNKLELPYELVDFLSTGKELEYDPGTSTDAGLVKLKSYEELELLDIYIREPGYDELYTMPGDQVPRDGYYKTTAISLIKSASGGYSPDGILVWLPKLQIFGSFDYEHLQLYVFPNTKWSDITKSPTKYLDSQWTHPVGVINFNPRKTLKFYSGEPPHYSLAPHK